MPRNDATILAYLEQQPSAGVQMSTPVMTNSLLVEASRKIYVTKKQQKLQKLGLASSELTLL